MNAATAKRSAPRATEGTEGKALTSCREDTARTAGTQARRILTIAGRKVSIPAPPEGDGVHPWIASAARSLERAGIGEDEAVEAIESLGGALRRPFGAGEVERGVAAIYASDPCERYLIETDDDPVVETSTAPTLRRPKRPRVRRDVGKIPKLPRDPQRIRAIAEDPQAWSVEAMLADSPCEVRMPTLRVLEGLFPDDPLLCVGMPKGDEWRDAVWRLSEFRQKRKDPGSVAQLVPNPMTARTGRTQTGGTYCRTKANTGPRRYLVTEFDSDGWSTAAAVVGHLRHYLDLVLVMSSGGKSLHAWWHVEGIPDDELAPFWRYATQLGADPALWTPCQFARMPNGVGWRRGPTADAAWFKVHQSILYLDVR